MVMLDDEMHCLLNKALGSPFGGRLIEEQSEGALLVIVVVDVGGRYTGYDTGSFAFLEVDGPMAFP